MDIRIDTSGKADVSTTLSNDRLSALKDILEDDDVTSDQVKEVLTELVSTTTGVNQKEEFTRLLGFVGKGKLREIVALTIRTLEFLTPATGGRRSRMRVSQRTSRRQRRHQTSRHRLRQSRRRSSSQPRRHR
jgi:hypothetical protein